MENLDKIQSNLLLLAHQRSHLLLILSNPLADKVKEFTDWYRRDFRGSISRQPQVLRYRAYERHNVDITRGRYEPLPYLYLAIAELSLDGASEGASLIETVKHSHAAAGVAESPATWLYYPGCEAVGQAPTSTGEITVAFANGPPGEERSFREFYATRHIRHALQIPALLTGQCFHRTEYQLAGSYAADFDTIAIYELGGEAQSIIDSFNTLPADALAFPMLDRSRFTEWVYRPVS